MARNDQIYQSVTTSPLMTAAMNQVYWALWPYEQGLTKGEVAMALHNAHVVANDKEPWEKQLPLMAKMGLVKRGNKRHCTAKNKEDVVWLLTEQAVPVKPKANKPSAKAYLKAVTQFEALITQHDQAGDGLITPELRKLYEWVRDKAEVKSS